MSPNQEFARKRTTADAHGDGWEQDSPDSTGANAPQRRNRTASAVIYASNFPVAPPLFRRERTERLETWARANNRLGRGDETPSQGSRRRVFVMTALAFPGAEALDATGNGDSTIQRHWSEC